MFWRLAPTEGRIKQAAKCAAHIAPTLLCFMQLSAAFASLFHLFPTACWEPHLLCWLLLLSLHPFLAPIHQEMYVSCMYVCPYGFPHQSASMLVFHIQMEYFTASLFLRQTSENKLWPCFSISSCCLLPKLSAVVHKPGCRTGNWEDLCVSTHWTKPLNFKAFSAVHWVLEAVGGKMLAKCNHLVKLLGTSAILQLLGTCFLLGQCLGQADSVAH